MDGRARDGNAEAPERADPLMPLARNAPCPCGSGARTKSCCGPVLEGRLAATPEALMRSRYTAYATGAVRHLVATTAPESPHLRADLATWRAELAAYCAAARFDGLAVFGSEADGDRGTVTFFARISVAGRDQSFGEQSRFVRRDDRWLYVDGDPFDARGEPVAIDS